MNVLQVLNALTDESGRKAKVAILEANKDVPYLKEFFEYALNPYKTYYIKKIPQYSTAGTSESLGGFFHFLETRLMSRAVTGHAALDELAEILGKLNTADAEVARRVMIKDPRCGVQESTVNNVWTDLVPTYPCLLAKAYDEKSIKKITYPACSQIKSDGMRFNAIYHNGSVTFRARSGQVLDLRGYLENDFILLGQAYGGDCVFDGELVVRPIDGKTAARKVGNGILTKSIKGTISDDEAAMAFANLWDVIPYDEFVARKSKATYINRYRMLVTCINNAGIDRPKPRYELIPTKDVKNFEEAKEHFAEAIAAGEEGTMLKNWDGLWIDDRSKDLVKMKSEKECDLRIKGWNPGKAGSKRDGKIGSLICASEDDKVVVNVSGFSDDLLDEITANFDSEWLNAIAAIRYNERITSKGKGREETDSLFLPRFIEKRLDKKVADSSADIK